MQFVTFTEENEHEGETWDFHLQLDGNEKEIDALFNLLAEIENDEGFEQEYQLDTNPISESDVDVLVKHAHGSYRADHNKVTGKFTCPELDEKNDCLSDLFYKGGIEDYFVK